MTTVETLNSPDGRFTMRRVGALLHTILRIAPDGALLALSEEALVSLRRQGHQRFGLLFELDANTSAPTDSYREEARRFYVRHQHELLVLGGVVRGSGFQAAMARAVFAGQRLVTRPPYPTRLATSRTELCTWLSTVLPKSPVLPTGAELVALLEPYG